MVGSAGRVVRTSIFRRRIRPGATLVLAAVAALAVLLPSCAKPDNSNGKQVIVVGFDGMEPNLTREMMLAGRLPNFSRLWEMGGEQGGFRSLETTIPPQSPVAWSTMITGRNPGGHGIFDFIHRDPAPEEGPPIRLYASHADTTEDKWVIDDLFGYRIPLRPGKQRLLRHGKPFWQHLTEAGIPTWIYRMPSNYPLVESEGAEFHCLTDMGTPDLKETHGTFSYYTSDREDFREKERISGGGKAFKLLGEKDTRRYRSRKQKKEWDISEDGLKHLDAHAFVGKFDGPDNTLKAAKEDRKPVLVPFTINRDPEDAVLRIAWQDQVAVLHEGEWSDWYAIEFEMIPYLASIKAECRFYIKEVHPSIKIYVSPFNFDPLDPNAPVSLPQGFAVEVAQAVGRYYTQGLPEETQGLKHGVLTREEFLEQADLVYQERMKLLDFALDHFTTGMLYFYFGSTDMIGHMFWGARTPNHPALTTEEQQKYAHEMERVYEDADRALGKVLARCPDATIIVLSDHGFDTFTRGFNLNTWLLENGYLERLYDTAYSMPLNIDFSQTRAYGMGINGLYVNLQGREKAGIVHPAAKQALLDEISKKLLTVVDPENGKKVIKEVYQCAQVYSGPYVDIGPDLQIGYASAYRGSWDTVLGGVPETVVVDNTEAWCADHCIATDLVPGIVLANRPIRAGKPSLLDIAPTILGEFGVPVSEEMEGHSIFAPSEEAVPTN